MKCYIDIDGILNFYPGCWLDYIFNQTGSWYENLQKAKGSLSHSEYTDLKDKYRTSDYKASLPVRQSGKAIADYLHNHGWTIIIGTTRPVLQYPKLIDTTIRWLEINQIPFDDIVFHRDNTMALFDKHPDIVMGIDDDPHIANRIADTGRVMFTLYNPINPEPTSNYVISVDSLYEIVKWLE